MSGLVQLNPWDELRRYTQARIALGRVGASLPTAEVLKFGLAHAQARDAVHHPLDVGGLAKCLAADGFHVLHACSEADDRNTYLLRPDLGRRLHAGSLPALHEAARPALELAVVVADGLSSFAAEHHALPLLQQLRTQLALLDWTLTPIVIATQARVALGDDIGEALGARIVLMLIGERPGLSSPDSLGAYITYAPRRGRMDSERNCVSNIHGSGMSYPVAAHKIGYLLREALRLKLSGVDLKDDSGEVYLPPA
ncbi:MAG: ethanolamine ammonia-lyase subunit EutC [Halothiobacillaceae bacterium]|nr:ethanolamine ammonia-lyase subunit EutC [Halothiobacillaceae bacterium]